MIDFEKIDYLKDGSARQKSAYQKLTKYRILEKLADFNPILAGTIPINIDIPESDLDIICHWTNKIEFINLLKKFFSKELNFSLKEVKILNEETVITNFRIDNFEIEIFGQNIPCKFQNAFKHMLIEYQILREKGEEFRQKVIELKMQGIKTEPAFAKLLNLIGDPYISLLNY